MKIENYNNIGIALVAFLSVIKNFEIFDYSKALLIQPLLLHNPLVNYVKKANVKVNGIEDLTIEKVEFFLNFNNRYFSLLSLSINTILIAQKMQFIQLENNQIIINKEQIDTFNFKSNSLGNRAEKIILASEKISKIFQNKTDELYFKLRVEI